MSLEKPQKREKTLSPEEKRIISLRWDILPVSETKQLSRELEDTLREKDNLGIAQILRRDMLPRSFVVHRGEKDHYLGQLYRAVLTIIGNEFNIKRDTKSFREVAQRAMENVEEEQILKLFHDLNIPEQIIREAIVVTGYHKKNENLVSWGGRIILNNEGLLRDKKIAPMVLMDNASLFFSSTGDSKRALAMNNEALKKLRSQEIVDPVLLNKIKIGKTLQSGLSSRERAVEFERVADNFQKLGVADYDRLRALQYAAEACLELAKGQKGKQEENRKSNIEKSLHIAKSTFSEAEEIAYPNAMVHSTRLLEKILREAGDRQESKKWLREAAKLEKEFRYRY